MIKISEKYTQGVKVPDNEEYPFGGSLNSTSDIAEDGFPMEEQWFNDVNGFFQGLMTYAQIEPNNTPDHVKNPQIINALVGLKYDARVDYAIGSTCIGADGKLYVALKVNKHNAPVNPVADGSGTWDELKGAEAVQVLIDSLKTHSDDEDQKLKQDIDQLRVDMDSVESAIGGGTDRLMYPCDQLATTAFTLPADKNCFMAGPFRVADGVAIQVPDGARLVVV